MRIETRPSRHSTRRISRELVPPAGMKSWISTIPPSVSKRVSRISVSARYRREAARPPCCGAMSQRPLSGVPSNAAKQASESNRGQHSQSIDPSRPTSAALRQSPIRA